jgi:NgoMIV restriction enzyme
MARLSMTLSERLPHGRVELPQRTTGARPDIDRVGGHAREPYRPSSALTCSQGSTVGLGGVETASGLPPLHAAISCKWTIRSDRVQNIRHECLQMIRHRRGRQPHLVTVTAEPLPSRLASIARGTGEVDAVYHIAYDAMAASAAANANPEQAEAWREVTGQRRVLSYEFLTATLAAW